MGVWCPSHYPPVGLRWCPSPQQVVVVVVVVRWALWRRRWLERRAFLQQHSEGVCVQQRERQRQQEEL